MLSGRLRVRLVAATTGVIGAVTAVAALLGWDRVALAGLAVLAVLTILVVLVVRGHLHRQVAALQASVTTQLSTALQRPRSRAELEAQLAATTHQLARLDDLERASFRASIRQYIRTVHAEHALRPQRPSSALQLPFKLRNIEFAASHGIAVPQVYAVWPDVGAIDLSEAPETFVLKSDGGAGSVGVFPLRRVGTDRFALVGAEGEFSQAELTSRIADLGKRARAPYFIEEMLHAPAGGPIPPDVKLYMFYGEVGQVLVRTVGTHGDPSTIRVKFVDEFGTNFGKVAVGRPHDHRIAVPESLPEMVSIARHLSRAVGLPFCRVDLYESSRGIVLGEITRAPSGGNERFVDEHDELLGRCWVDATARLTIDLGDGRPVGALFGTQADLHLYPDTRGRRDPASFERTIVDCSQWCTAATAP